MAGGFCTIDKSKQNTTKTPNAPATIIEVLSPLNLTEQLEYRVWSGGLEPSIGFGEN
jgi:hypothetical protein